MRVCICACVCARVHVCVHMHIHTFKCAVCMCTCVYVCVHVCMCVGGRRGVHGEDGLTSLAVLVIGYNYVNEYMSGAGEATRKQIVLLKMMSPSATSLEQSTTTRQGEWRDELYAVYLQLCCVAQSLLSVSRPSSSAYKEAT